jgi:hypothetical protein
MKSRAVIFLFKTLLFIVPVFILFEVLFQLGFFPIITDSTIFDLKMITIQKHPVKNLNVLSMGSSITLYELNSHILMQNLNVPYYNFASWGLQMADIRPLLNIFVKEYKPKYVVICSSVRDFTSAQNNSYLNYINTGSYLRDHFPEIFYLKNYNSLHQVIRRKYNTYPVDFDNWGGAVIKNVNRDKEKEVHFIFPTKYTPAQYRELDSLSASLKSQNVKLIFIQAPVKASYANIPVLKQAIKAHFDKCRLIVEAHGGIYLNYHNPGIFTDSLFADDYHLQADGAVILTKKIAADLKKIIK